MQKFTSSLPSFKFEKICENNLLTLEKTFDAFPLHSINLLVPSSAFERKPFEDILISDDNVYFIVKDVSASSLIEIAFLENFLRSGNMLATSYDARVEIENFLCIIPPGKLVLSLEREISKCLALTKENKNKKKKEKKTFDTIIIDVSYSAFSPGKKIYDFVLFELSKIEHIKFSILLKWKPYGNVCPHSIKTYFASRKIECIPCKPNLCYSSKFSVIAPKLNADEFDTILEDLLEWIGTEVCEINYSQEGNEYVSKFFPSSSSEVLKKLHRCNFEGFYSKLEAIPLLKRIGHLFQKDNSIPYVVTFLNGFQDSFVSANEEYFTSADKFICIITFPSSKHWIITFNAR